MQHKRIQLSILVYLSVIKEILLWKLETKPHLLLMKNHLFSQSSAFLPSVFDSVKNNHCMILLNDWESFGTVHNDVHKKTKIYNFINHVNKSTTIQKPITIYHACHLERTQMLTLLAMSFQNPHFAGYHLTWNRCNFFYV